MNTSAHEWRITAQQLPDGRWQANAQRVDAPESGARRQHRSGRVAATEPAAIIAALAAARLPIVELQPDRVAASLLRCANGGSDKPNPSHRRDR